MTEMKYIAGLAGSIGCVCCLAAAHAADGYAPAYDGPKENLHVYAIAGVIGSPDESASESTPVIERCYILNDARQWVPARLSRDSLAYGFVNAMLATDNEFSIGLVFVSRPGTKLEDWHRKSEHFRQLRGGIKAAKQLGVAKGLLWQHGESILGSAIDHMKDLFAYLRAEHGLNFPIVAGEIPGGHSMNAQIAAVASDVHAVRVASVSGLAADGTQFKEGGRQALGERYAEQMLEVQREWVAREKIRPRSEIPCVDIHVHGSSNKENGLDIVDQWMQKNNVLACVTLDLTPTRAEGEMQRQYMLANFERHRGRILHCTYIDPDEVNTVEEAVKILEKAKADGTVGFGEHYGRNLLFDDPKNLRLYAACEIVGLPVTFHIDSNKNMVEKGMRRVERVLEMFPEGVFIAHADWWSHLPEGTCDRMLQQYPNLYAETCAATTVLNRDRRYAREFLIRNADKILYGSDEGWWSFADAERHEPFFQLCDELDLPEDVKEKIYRGNAERLFGLVRRKL